MIRLPIDPKAPLPWLGGLSPQQFMRRYWQKKPLWVKGAFPGWRDTPAPVSIADVLSQASDDRLPSRMVDPSFRVVHGPFSKKQIPSFAKPKWTILVQQVNTALYAADQFLDGFRFLPEGRLDDLMISVASDGGGIGAHVDSYDVFLIQAQGQRRWEIAETFAPDLQHGIDLKILKKFKPEKTMLLHPGDLLYLPPGVAHRGTAVGSHCMTYSVGFRAPSAAEIADMAFGQHLDQKTQIQAPWTDPWLSASDRPGILPDRLVLGLTQQAVACLPSRREIAQEVVIALSAPHPSVFFTPPEKLSFTAFYKRVEKGATLRLSPGSRLLVWHDFIALNGEPVDLPEMPGRDLKAVRMLLTTLASTREVETGTARNFNRNHPLARLVWDWFCQGMIWLKTDPV